MLFKADHTAGDMYQAAHFAELIAVLGPPPAAFLELNPEKAAQFWDEEDMCCFVYFVVGFIADLVI
jgi:hypothetical protein